MDGLTPAARVTWSTTVPPECVASARVEFRTGSQSGPVVATNTTTNTSQTEFIQTGLQCGTNYYITVVVTSAASGGVRVTLSSSQVQVFVGGKQIVCKRFTYHDGATVIVQISPHRYKLELKSQQTTQLSEYHGSGHVRVCPCVLTSLEFTIDLREAL